MNDITDIDLNRYNLKNLEKDTIANEDNSAIFRAIFLIILAVSGNYVGETLGCQLQRSMTNSMVVKQIIIMMMIYFTLNFTSSEHPHPLEVAKKTFLIWLVYLMFSRMSGKFNGAVILIFIVFYVMGNYSDYYESYYSRRIESAETTEEKDVIYNEYVKLKENLITYQEYTLYILIITIILGFVLYAREKWIEYYDDFSFSKFIFGVPQCKGLKEKVE